jgi:hypothetical protein
VLPLLAVTVIDRSEPGLVTLRLAHWAQPGLEQMFAAGLLSLGVGGREKLGM